MVLGVSTPFQTFGGRLLLIPQFLTEIRFSSLFFLLPPDPHSLHHPSSLSGQFGTRGSVSGSRRNVGPWPGRGSRRESGESEPPAFGVNV